GGSCRSSIATLSSKYSISLIYLIKGAVGCYDGADEGETMPRTRWDERFFASTRGRIVQLLRRATSTVDELAEALGLTDNAVRAHLAILERDGLVQQKGVRRGV